MKNFLLFLLTLSLFGEELPEWIFKTEDSKYIYGVGSAPRMGNYSKELRIAKMVARANLSENISVNVSSNFEMNIQKGKKQSEYSTVQTSSHLLRFAKVEKVWRSESGELFVLISVEKNDLVDNGIR